MNVGDRDIRTFNIGIPMSLKSSAMIEVDRPFAKCNLKARNIRTKRTTIKFKYYTVLRRFSCEIWNHKEHISPTHH